MRPKLRQGHHRKPWKVQTIKSLKTLNTAYEELTSKGTYKKLLEVVKKYNKSKLEEKHTKEETARLQTELKELECTLYDEEKFYHRRIAECMADIGKIKDEIEDFLVESEIKTDYIEKWQNSKIEMNEILLEGKEQQKLKELKKIDADMYKESRVHQEIVAAYSEMQKDIIIETAKWEKKYNKDCKQLEAKIEAMKDKREKQNEATKILKETYLKREREINDYKIYKIQQEEKKMILQKRNEAATKIQAWWRGTMVRKGFGKFRKKKDKKGKKKGPEKK
ncbi:IQ domain-containing protein G-like [Anoplophora glabripennis]|uniref:IQ domain-containing protein G-like n=1 Tax=Anoplophora glabripennis TaxID=217634 RepID=UPI000873D8DF|nr:IQ domain-containing protein G-like [Anoplophora glabripennis]